MKKYAIIFSGQHLHVKKMISNFKKYSFIIERVFKKSSQILKYNLFKKIKNQSYNDQNNTKIIQPAILTLSFAIWNIWKKKFKYRLPNIMAGHSLGEYSALLCSGHLKFKDAIHLINVRAKLMQKETKKNNGKMAIIIGLKYKIIKKICQSVAKDEIVYPAILNLKKQIVISGNKNAVYRVLNICKKNGAKQVFPIAINIASHCMLMKPITKKLFYFIQKKIKFYKSKIPIINNVNAKIEKKPKKIIKALIKQLYMPVRWLDIVKSLIQRNIKFFIEIGPNNILSNLIQEINKNVISISIYNDKSLILAIKTLSKYLLCN